MGSYLTGYGQQTSVFAPRIRDAGHDVTISTFWGLNGGVLVWDGIPVYPADESWGNLYLPEYAERLKADLVITLMDVWVLNPDAMSKLPLACWTPVDHQPAPTRVADFFRKSGARPIAMSRFGERMLQEAGLDPLYVPHGVDTNVFKPAPDREALRKAYSMDGAFVVGIVANNAGGLPPASGPPRKAFPESLIAFAQFQQSHPDAKLYLHTEMTGRQFPGNQKPGLDLTRLIDKFGIPIESVMLTDPYKMETGVEPHEMASLYSSFDVLLNPSYGEGFGIPIVEAQACGTPVIATDWTSMPELVGAGWMSAGDEPWYDAQHDSFFMRPRVCELVDALEAAYEARGDQGLRDQARGFALGYDADHVMETYWKPALEALMAPREVAPLPNRAARRAKVKA